MKITLSLALTLAAAPVAASGLAQLQSMQAAGPAGQASAFTGERPSDMSVAAGPGTGGVKAGAGPAVKPAVPAVTAAPPPSEPPPPERAEGSRTRDMAVGAGALLVGGFWTAMGITALSAGAVTVAGVLPVAAGILAIGIGVSLLRGKMKL